jgi:hypothetical protein
MEHNDEEVLAQYRERGIPTEWQEMTPPTMAPAFRVWYRAYPSTKMPLDAAAEADELIHDPLTALRNAGIVSTDEVPHISTMVVNHEKTLNRLVMHAIVVASTNPDTVGITIAKEEEKVEGEEVGEEE